MTTRSFAIALLALTITAFAPLCATAQPAPEPRLEIASTIVAGVPWTWTAKGLLPGATARVHAVGRYERWEPVGGRYSPVMKTVHAWADFVADGDGQIVGASAIPVSGTYRLADATGLMWSGFVEGSPGLPPVIPSELYQATARVGTLFAIEVDGKLVSTSSTTVARGGEGVTDIAVRAEGVHGWFASPSGAAARLPAVIVLHGSEGGNWLGKDVARDYAAHGFAVLALDYFAPGDRAAQGLPESLTGVELETIDRAYRWLAARADVDPARVAIVGTSRGGELALVSGVVFDWPMAIIGCVPSDLVTDGYAPTEPRRNHPSWTLRGEPLPFIRFADTTSFTSGAEAFRASVLTYPEDLSNARIRVEGIEAPLLLLGGEADTVWPSGEMVRRIVARRAEAGRVSDTEAHVYAGAGHQICGNGLWPLRLYGVDGEGDRNLSMLAEGEANQDAWRQQIAFLNETLK